jgi:hypothetical protein
MPIFRATVWTLSAMAAAVDGDNAIRRRIVELSADDERSFEAAVQDWYIDNVDNEVWFGPISQKDV